MDPGITGAAAPGALHADWNTDFLAPVVPIAERHAAGKALRAKTPHEAHAHFARRQDDVDPVAILEAQARTRLPDLVPIRHARMLASPFAFLRGAAAVMAADLAASPVSGLTVQACGDAHVGNFGVFASAERELVFAINDFDETQPGPWEWDVKRLAASVIVAGRFLGGSEGLCRDAARATVESYRRHLHEYAQMSHLDVWYARISDDDILDALPREPRETAERIMAKARKRNHLQVLSRMTELVDDEHHIVEEAPLIVRETHADDGHPIGKVVDHALHVYLDSLPEERRVLFTRYRLQDVARKVVGVGSVGTRCRVLLFEGVDGGDPLFLQYKEAQPSVLAAWTGSAAWDCEGRRVVVGQRLIQGAPDIFLGWGIGLDGTHFYMRQLRDMKGSWQIDHTARPKYLDEYGKLCGWALALAHAKSGDAAAIAGYVGKNDAFGEAVTQFASTYADQTERDHAALAQAVKRGRLPVAKG